MLAIIGSTWILLYIFWTFLHSLVRRILILCKVEKILKGSLDSIPSPSVKIQIKGGKVCLRCKGKTLLGVVNKLLKTKSLLTSPSNVLPYYLKENLLQVIRLNIAGWCQQSFLFSKLYWQHQAMFCLYTSINLSRP